MAFAYTKLMQAMVAAGVVSATDPYFNLVTLLLPGNGTNGAQNNTFLDSSSNNFTITRNGNTTQGTFSPFSQTGWGNYFDGTDDYLAVADNAVLRPGTSNFTLEAWIYRGASGAAHTIYAKGGASTGIVFQVTSTNVLRFTHTTTNIDSTGTIAANTWTHVAVVREGTSTNQTKLYINGTQDGQGTVSTDFTQTEEVRIGTNRGATDDFNGYISNLRFVKGTALYTGTFTPSTTPLTTTSQGATSTEVELLTCQDNRFLDNSSNAFAITVNGTPSVQAFSPFAPTAAYSAATNGGSGYFDGTGDWLRVPYSTNWEDLGTGDFEISCWFYLNSTSDDQTLLSAISTWTTTMAFAMEVRTTKALHFWAGNNAPISINGGTVNAKCWNYAVASRVSGTTRLFLNGVEIGTAHTGSVNITDNEDLGVGTFLAGNVASSNFVNGHISGVRIRKGSGVTSVTVPTSPLTAITDTQLLLNFTNAGITDATAKNDLETVGNAQISTTQSKFGGSSMYFDGTGDYLSSPSSQNYAFGTGDFTIELWVYSNDVSSASNKGMMQTSAATGGLSTTLTNGVFIAFGQGSTAGTGNNGGVYARINNNHLGGNSATATGAWYHIALTRASGTARLFVNGTQIATISNSSDVTATNLAVGGYYDTNQLLNGYIDDLRITRGYARYTSSFTPPTAAFPLS